MAPPFPAPFAGPVSNTQYAPGATGYDGRGGVANTEIQYPPLSLVLAPPPEMQFGMQHVTQQLPQAYPPASNPYFAPSWTPAYPDVAPGRPTQVRPVGALDFPGQWSAPQLNVLMGPAAAAIAQGLAKNKPILVPGKGNDFILRFPAYLEQLAMGSGTLNDAARLALLEDSLPMAGKSELQRRREEAQRGSGPPLTWSSVWSWIVLTYGEDTQQATMEELRSLRPENRGKLTAVAWLTYAAEFRLRHARLENPRVEEVQELIMSNAPESCRTSFFRELAKREQRKPTLRLTGMSGVPIPPIEQLVRQLLGPGDHHLRMWPQGAGIHVELGNPVDKQTLLNYSGCRTQSGHSLVFAPVKQHMGLEDTLNWVLSDLKCRETSDGCVKSLGRIVGPRAPIPKTRSLGSGCEPHFDHRGTRAFCTPLCETQDTNRATQG